MKLKERIQELAKANHENVVGIRHHLHAHPELSFKEFETSKFVAKELERVGVEFETGYVETGIVALIKGRNPESKITALRADLDALPINELNDKPYKSKNEGVMHACGHDVHTASLLGAANILNQVKDDFEGTVKLIFQPGEERLPGGASLMIKEGALENPTPTSIIGQHVYPQLEAGKVGMRPGMYMASADEIHVTVRGKGGHAALPHNCIDPVVITAHIIVALQQVISRRTKPGNPSVLTFGRVIADGATNIIPDEVTLQGTFRAMDEEWRLEAHRILKKMAEQMAEAMGGSCDFEVRMGYPCVINDEALTNHSFAAAEDYMGKENVVLLEPRMTGEDFSYYSQMMPGCFYRLGTGNKEMGITSGVHMPTFDIDESALEIGSGLMAWLAVSALKG
ncbi:MAG: amidohydrolase [Granulosicoccus sp.]|jgi:amidohydrolase